MKTHSVGYREAMKKSILVCAILLLSASGHAECPSADLTGDCYVGLADFALMAIQWKGDPNRADFSAMLSQWMMEGVPDDPQNLVWAYIDDPGVFGYEGFDGYMSRYKTTNAQYCEYLNAAYADGLITVDNDIVYATSDTGHLEPYFDTYIASTYNQITYDGSTFSVRIRDGYDMSDHPVVMVSWYGATAFCNYYGYRLPTEWEWQAAADHDGSYTYGCGTSINQSMANYFDNAYANPLGLSSFPYTSPVNHYSSYGYGLNDMAGNVWEWTNSIYSDNYRVVRGGSWSRNDSYCTVTSWDHLNPSSTYSSIGFRVCR